MILYVYVYGFLWVLMIFQFLDFKLCPILLDSLDLAVSWVAARGPWGTRAFLAADALEDLLQVKSEMPKDNYSKDTQKHVLNFRNSLIESYRNHLIDIENPQKGGPIGKMFSEHWTSRLPQVFCVLSVCGSCCFLRWSPVTQLGEWNRWSLCQFGIFLRLALKKTMRN